MDVRMGLFDRMVAAVSPERGARRMIARAALNAGTMMANGSPVAPGGQVTGQGGYYGGQTNRRQTRGWRARLRTPNQDAAKRDDLIARSREAAMNMPLGTAAIERPIDFTVGSGLMAIPEIVGSEVGLNDDEAAALNRQLGKDYDDYMSSTDPDAERGATGYGLQEIIMRGVLESGDIAAFRCWADDQAGRSHFSAWKLVEAEWIVSPFGHVEGTALAGTGNIVSDGVEVDGYNAPIAVHVLKKAPDGAYGGKYNRRSGDTVRVPLWGEKSGLPTVVLVKSKRRPGQTRGIPALAPVIEILRQVSDLTEAELFAAVMTAMLAIIYKSPGAQAMPEADYGDVAGHDRLDGLDIPTRPQSNIRMEAGQVLEIDTDAEVDVKSPGRPNPAFDPFFLGMVRQLSAATKVPYEILLLHFTASYSASRGALESFYVSYVFPKREWLSSLWCDIGYQVWLYEQVVRGVYRMPGFLTNGKRRAAWSRVRHRGDGKISLNPSQEAKALEVYEAHGWATGAQITAALNGGDYDTNVTVRIAEHQRFVDGGLPIPNAKGGGSDTAAQGSASDSGRGEDE